MYNSFCACWVLFASAKVLFHINYEWISTKSCSDNIACLYKYIQKMAQKLELSKKNKNNNIVLRKEKKKGICTDSARQQELINEDHNFKTIVK